MKRFVLFALTAVVELLGCYLAYRWLREGPSAWCVFRTNVTGRFGMVTGDSGNVTDDFGNVSGRTGRQDRRCA
ncbi:hypothetical protein [Paraburkholderia sp. 40]|uniref:hypothetical protein n=1 Tax=Paraburkholderia sp. 40 TaxID=2991059 RepID=UPI003D20D103